MDKRDVHISDISGKGRFVKNMKNYIFNSIPVDYRSKFIYEDSELLLKFYKSCTNCEAMCKKHICMFLGPA